MRSDFAFAQPSSASFAASRPNGTPSSARIAGSYAISDAANSPPSLATFARSSSPSAATSSLTAAVRPFRPRSPLPPPHSPARTGSSPPSSSPSAKHVARRRRRRLYWIPPPSLRLPPHDAAISPTSFARAPARRGARHLRPSRDDARDRSRATPARPHRLCRRTSSATWDRRLADDTVSVPRSEARQ